MQKIKESVAEEGVRLWSDEVLRQMTKRHLQQISVYREHMTKVDDDLLARISAVGKPTIADKRAAMAIGRITMVDRAMAVQPEEAVITMGGSLMYSPEVTMVTKLNSEKEIWQNSPVPGSTVVEGRENIASLTALCAQVVVQSGGEWKALAAPWTNVLGKDGLDCDQLFFFGRLIGQMCESTLMWKSMTTLERNAVTGPKQLMFVRQMLVSTDQAAYHYLNTFIVLEILGAYAKVSAGWAERVGEDGVPLVPRSCYKEVKVTSEDRKKFDYSVFKDKGYPKVFLYQGGYTPKVDVPVKDGTLAMALATTQKIRQVAGSDNSAMLSLASMRGYSGFMSEMGKRIHFLLSATLTAWSEGYVVDIRLTSDGDLIPLLSALRYWQKGVRGDEFFKEMKDVESDQWVMFLPFKRTSVFHSSVMPFVRNDHRENAVAICYNRSSLPTSPEKKVAMDYDGQSQYILPKGLPKNFIFYTCIFGAAPFPNDKDVKAIVKKRTDPSSFEFFPDCHVYGFSNAFSFCGVLSSWSSLSLVGYGYEMKDRAWDMQVEPHYCSVPLKRYVSQALWYDNVAADAAAVVLSMFTAVLRYSPITNFLQVTKKSIATSLLTLEGEDAYVSRVLETKRKAYGSVLQSDFSDGENDVGGEDVVRPVRKKGKKIKETRMTDTVIPSVVTTLHKPKDTRPIVEDSSVSDDDEQEEQQDDDGEVPDDARA